MGLSKGSSDRQFLFINGRPVDLPKAGASLISGCLHCARKHLAAAMESLAHAMLLAVVMHWTLLLLAMPCIFVCMGGTCGPALSMYIWPASEALCFVLAWDACMCKIYRTAWHHAGAACAVLAYRSTMLRSA